ncbi:MAG: hypothetical protein K2Q18_03790 [Bdellovibrionales bacterium]|nr:hypothetical protein [Bdellovibrionales bacterium]
MEVKKSKSAQAAAQDFLSIEMIEVELDSDNAKRTKESAQKILGMMFASLHKKGRPSKHQREELEYGI